MADLSLKEFEQVHENLGSGERQFKLSECFTVDFGDMKSKDGKKTLQESFLKFRKQKQKEIRDDRRLRAKRMRQQGDEGYMNKLRKKFVKRAKKYYGVPYAKKYWSPDTPEYKSKRFLDCCGLVRQVMWDLRKDFGFKLGPWNQAYMYDLLPTDVVKEEDMKPGDLVFISGIYPNPKARQQKHFMTHVEIWAGDGIKTIGARWNNGKVQLWDSYKFEAKSFHSAQYHFKSIDTWLQGICRSFCPTHKWRRGYNPNKKSIFNVDEQQKTKIISKESDQQGQGQPAQGPSQILQDIQQPSSQQEEDDERDYEEEEIDDEDDGPPEAAYDSDNEVDSQQCTPREEWQGSFPISQLPPPRYFLEDGPTRQQYYQGQDSSRQDQRSPRHGVPFSNRRYQTQIGFALSLNSRKQAPLSRAGTSLGNHQPEKQEASVRQTSTEVLLQRIAKLEVNDKCITRISAGRQRPLGMIDTSHRTPSASPACRFPIIYNDVHKQMFDRARGIQGKHIGPISLRNSPPRLPECTNNSGQSSPEQQDEVRVQSQHDVKRSDSLLTIGSRLSYGEISRNCETVTPCVIELFDTTLDNDAENKTKENKYPCDTTVLKPCTSRSQPGLLTSEINRYMSLSNTFNIDTTEFQYHPESYIVDTARSQPDNSGSQTDSSRSQPDNSGSQTNSSRLQPDNSGSQTDSSRSHPDDSGSQKESSRLQPDNSGSQTDSSKLQPDNSGSQTDCSRSQPNNLGSQTDSSRSQPDNSGSFSGGDCPVIV